MDLKAGHPKIGLLPGMGNLYNRLWPEMRAQLMAIGNRAASELGRGTLDVRIGEVASTREEVDRACAQLLSEHVDLLVIALTPYCASGVLKPALMKTDVPLLLWPMQTMSELKPEEYDLNAFMYNHGVHGIQDIANVLRRSGRPFGVVHGHWEQEDFLSELKAWAQAARAVRAMQECNPVQIGGHFEDMLDLQIGEEKFLTRMGIKPRILSLDKFADCMEEVDERAIKACVSRYRSMFDIANDFDDKMLAKTARTESALRAVMAEGGSHACGINFSTLCNDIRIADALHVAASMLMSEGFGYAGEGDWVTAALVHSMQQALGVASFSEIYSVGYRDHRLVLQHWGEGNFQMARATPNLLPSAFRDKIPAEFAIVDFEFEPGEATLINLNATPASNGQLITIPGAITEDHLPKRTGPRAVFKPHTEDVRKLLTEYAYMGGSHHLALAKGDCLEMVEKLCRLTGWAYCRPQAY